MVDLKLNNKILVNENYTESVKRNEEIKINSDIYMTKPFSVGLLTDFIDMSSETHLKIINELKSVKLRYKSNDLYKFRQSKDFKFLKKSETLQSIRSFFLTSVLTWMKSATEIDLYDNEIDITFSVYGDSDYLLCHDDHLEARRIAFVWYLLDGWSEENGGHLDLINTSTDSNKLNVIGHSFLPQHNSFIFFKVAENSFHQVREVKLNTSEMEKCRVSIHGWFRGPSLDWKTLSHMPEPARLSPVHIEEELLYKWINNIYLQDETTHEIRNDFVEQSEVQLSDFINIELYHELLNGLNSMEFHLNGSLNVRQVYLPKSSSVEYPELLQQFIRVLKSEAFFVLLSDITNLNLHGASQHDSEDDSENSESEAPFTKRQRTSNDDEVYRVGKCSDIEIRHWKAGCYSLLCDNDQRQKVCRLEMYFSLGFPNLIESDLNNGGYYSFIAEGEDQELLTVVPSSNSLSLVYADDHTMGFMKYLTHRYFDKFNGDSTMKLYDVFACFYEYE